MKFASFRNLTTVFWKYYLVLSFLLIFSFNKAFQFFVFLQVSSINRLGISTTTDWASVTSRCFVRRQWRTLGASTTVIFICWIMLVQPFISLFVSPPHLYLVCTSAHLSFIGNYWYLKWWLVIICRCASGIHFQVVNYF